MPQSISLKCSCGSLRGVATIPKSTGNRFVCLCDDCQAFAHFLGKAKEVLDANGGTEIIPVAPANLKITQGVEHVKCLRLSGKGMLRWYAGCCKSPIANTMASPKFPYAGVFHSIMDHASDKTTREKALGPIFARIQGKFGLGPLPEGTYQKASFGVIVSTVRFLAAAWFKGQHTPSPFFDAKTGQPKTKPYILTAAEREGLRKFCGPN